MESVMLKKLIAFALLTGSVSGFAQTLGDRMDAVGNRMEGTFPEVRAVEDKDEYKLHMGLTAGLNDPKGVDSSPEFGINVGFQPIVPFGLSLDASTSKLDDGSDEQRTTVLANGTYNFGGDIPVLKSSYLGVGGGPVIVDEKFEWAVAPVLGFDIPLTNKTHDYLSVGLNAKYLFVSDTPDSFITAAAVKYWY